MPTHRKTLRLTRIHRTILEQIDELQEIVRRPEDFASVVPAVSAWSVGQQLEHTLRVTESVLVVFAGFLAQPEAPPGGRPTTMGRAVLGSGYIPRGLGKAPEKVLPQELEREQVEKQWHEVRRQLVDLEPRLGLLAEIRATARHPVFGHLDARRWLRFLYVHQKHHLKILRDILRRSSHEEAGG